MLVSHHDAGFEGVVAACHNHFVEVAHHAIFQRHHHVDGLQHRAWLVAEHSMVFAFGVFAVLIAVEVGNRLDFAGAHFHQNGAAPLCLAFLQHRHQLVFHDVLELHIDGGGHVVARNGVATIVGGVGVECHLRCLHRHAKEQAIEKHFQSRNTVTATDHVFLQHGVEHTAALFQEWERGELVEHIFSDGLLQKLEVGAVLLASFGENLFPLLGRSALEHQRQTVAKGRELAFKLALVECLVLPVDIGLEI